MWEWAHLRGGGLWGSPDPQRTWRSPWSCWASLGPPGPPEHEEVGKIIINASGFKFSDYNIVPIYNSIWLIYSKFSANESLAHSAGSVGWILNREWLTGSTDSPEPLLIYTIQGKWPNNAQVVLGYISSCRIFVSYSFTRVHMRIGFPLPVRKTLRWRVEGLRQHRESNTFTASFICCHAHTWIHTQSSVPSNHITDKRSLLNNAEE